MTVSDSKYNGYDIDERLTIDAPVVIQNLLNHVSGKRQNDADIEVCKSAFGIKSLPTASTTQRSIFSTYWKTNRQLSCSPHSPLPIPSEVGTSEIPKRRQIIHNTFSYTYDRDPYQYFGIGEDEGKISTSDDDSESLNSYELFLEKNEIEVAMKNCRRSRTHSSLSFNDGLVEKRILNRAEKTTQSDTALFAKTSPSLKRVSCLRKSRFSVDTEKSCSDKTQLEKGDHRTSVTFEPRIEVHLFPPPAEEWAPKGWSTWFGGWH